MDSPISYSLILTQENGSRKYVTCLIFQEEFKQFEKVLKLIFNNFVLILSTPKKKFIRAWRFV